MMVPRSYTYSSTQPAQSTRTDRKDLVTVPVDGCKAEKNASGKGKARTTITPPLLLAASPASPSKPVVIPTRTQNGTGGGRRKSRDSAFKDRRRIAGGVHDTFSTPSSVTTLPAMTSSFSTGSSPQAEARGESLSSAHLKMQESKYRRTSRRSISSCSPQSWGVLLSPPEESDPEVGSFDSDTTLGPLSSVRSLSIESMPSLETDTESVSSTSNPATPGLSNNSRKNSDRRQKSLSTSIGEDCITDHPLLLSISQAPELEDDPPDDGPSLLPPTPSPLARSSSYFKSNLTASFRKIRFAAQSFSAFTAPPAQRDDYLARTLLSPEAQFTDERRPLPSIEPPDPALRRYLNPVTFSPSEFHFHSEESPQVTLSSCTASIQLQTYQRRTCGSDKASTPPIFTSAQQKTLDAMDGLSSGSVPRQREPRENCDFLRVVVLEMDMRQKGKLSDNSPGRARLWLPARQAARPIEEGTQGMEVEDGQRPKIPARWVGVTA